MNHTQQQALGILQAALLDATEAGVLDMLQDFTKTLCQALRCEAASGQQVLCRNW